MTRKPLDPTLATETGLFGDLTVAAGDEVVVGRYRYHVERFGNGLVGHMAFQIRDSTRRHDAVPVVLRFVSLEGEWKLEELSYIAFDSARVPAGTVPFEREHGGSEPSGLVHSINERLQPWIYAAVERLSDS